MPSSPKRTGGRLGAFTLAAVAVAALASGCGSSSSAAANSSASSTGTAPLKTVSVALDWTPNTNHIGIYVADKLGYYAKHGIKLKILPYAETAPETLVSRGIADFGFSYQAGIAYARAAGLDVRQVFANVSKPQYQIGVRADNNAIASPKDLDGKTYAGFGTPDEGPELKYVIQADGGKGDFKTVVLNTAAYDAVYANRADFTIAATTWDGLQAKALGKPLKYFDPTAFGFPANYSTAIASSDKWLQANSDTAKAFLAATQEGYQYAQSNPADAAKILVAANPQTLKDPKLVADSANMLASEGFYKDSQGSIGHVSPQVWTDYGNFLFKAKLLTGADGKPITAQPDWTAYYTNEYLPSP